MEPGILQASLAKGGISVEGQQDIIEAQSPRLPASVYVWGGLKGFSCAGMYRATTSEPSELYDRLRGFGGLLGAWGRTRSPLERCPGTCTRGLGSGFGLEVCVALALGVQPRMH